MPRPVLEVADIFRSHSAQVAPCGSAPLMGCLAQAHRRALEPRAAKSDGRHRDPPPACAYDRAWRRAVARWGAFRPLPPPFLPARPRAVAAVQAPDARKARRRTRPEAPGP